MLFEAIEEVMPRSAIEINAEWAQKFYEVCMKTCEAIDDPQVEARSFGPNRFFMVYDPRDQRLEVKLYSTEEMHDPYKSFLCWPGKITEVGYYLNGTESKRFEKEYRPYFNLHQGGRIWKMTYSDAPRRLEYLDRQFIPATRELLYQEISRIVERGYEKVRDNKNASLAYKGLYGRRRSQLLTFLTKVQIDGFNQEFLSREFVTNLRDRYTHITGLLDKLVYTNWSAADEAKWLKHFLVAFDPKGDLIDLENKDSDSGLVIQWREHVSSMSKLMPHLNTDGDPWWPDDLLGIGGWKDV